jgi:hypothetical protein
MNRPHDRYLAFDVSQKYLAEFDSTRWTKYPLPQMKTRDSQADATILDEIPRKI